MWEHDYLTADACRPPRRLSRGVLRLRSCGSGNLVGRACHALRLSLVEPSPASLMRHLGAAAALPGFSRLPGNADDTLLDDRDGEPSVLRVYTGLPEPAAAVRRRRLLVVQQPLVGPERPVEPHRVIQRGPDHVPDGPAAAAMRE